MRLPTVCLAPSRPGPARGRWWRRPGVGCPTAGLGGKRPHDTLPHQAGGCSSERSSKRDINADNREAHRFCFRPRRSDPRPLPGCARCSHAEGRARSRARCPAAAHRARRRSRRPSPESARSSYRRRLWGAGQAILPRRGASVRAAPRIPRGWRARERPAGLRSPKTSAAAPAHCHRKRAPRPSSRRRR